MLNLPAGVLGIHSIHDIYLGRQSLLEHMK